MPRPTIIGPDGTDDWFPTGDAGEVREGKVSIRGRLDYVVTSGGEKLWPEDLESLILTIPGVRDAAVFVIEDVEWGERVVALIVNDGADVGVRLTALAKERIGPWAVPKEIRYVRVIPRTGNGKIRRDQLERAR
jgi:O-succinylbenzoic acid--CoA ligase